MYELPAVMTLSRRSGESQEFLIRQCTDTDIFRVMRMQRDICEAIGDPGIYSLVDEEEVLESLKLDHCFGAFADGRLAGFTMMIDNRISHRNYGTYLDYPPERQKTCVSMEISIVDDEFRGFGLQKLFVRLREDAAARLGAEEALVTIGPDNKYSLANLQASGYEIVCTKPLYEGAMRHILRKQF